MTLRLVPILESQIRERGLEAVLEMEIPLIEVLLQMEMNGMRVNSPFLDDLSVSMTKKMERLLEEIYGDAGEEFNVDSPKQLQKILFADTNFFCISFLRSCYELSKIARSNSNKWTDLPRKK